MMKLVGIFILALAVVAHGSTTNPPTTEATTTPTTTPKETSPSTTQKPPTTQPETTAPTTQKPPTTQPETTAPTTHKPPTTHAETTAPTTTPEKTTVTEPKTTATEPKTTATEAPTVKTTAASTENPTTHAATTGSDVSTSSEVTTMTPAPVTTPDTPQPPKEPWFVNNTDTVCIIMRMGARMSISYEDKHNKTSTAQFDLPTDADVSGSCNATGGQFIEFTFHTNWTLRFTFEENKDSNVEVTKVKLVYDFDPKVFTNISADMAYEVQTARLVNQTLFPASSGNSYVCNSNSEIKLNDMAKITTADLQVQAYHTKNDMKFGTTQQCDADAKTSNIVPIAVGAALAALVVIVLIAYLISRNKNKGGYESV